MKPQRKNVARTSVCVPRPPKKPALTSSSDAPKRKLKFAPQLVTWFQQHKRSMPWRENRDPYRVWISEIMLQQTQVVTVIPYFERFMLSFPSVQDLAKAPLEDVLRHWSGLGYYSRARNLHRGAQAVVAHFGGKVPDRADAIREIPGIGPYTAGAILSIAYGKPEPIVDGNVARVLSRILLIDGDVRRGDSNQQVWTAARSLVESGASTQLDPGDVNQGLMELGATVCTPRNPDCERCPLAKVCAARQKGEQEKYPRIQRRAASPVWHLRAWVIENGAGQVLFAQRAPDGLFGCLWELPTERINESTRQKPPALKFTHTLTHRVLQIELSFGKSSERCWSALENFEPWSGTYVDSKWISIRDALSGKSISLSSVQKKMLRVLREEKESLFS